MDKHILKTLRELQARLRDTEPLTESDRRAVEELHDEIERLLARSKKRPAVRATAIKHSAGRRGETIRSHSSQSDGGDRKGR